MECINNNSSHYYLVRNCKRAPKLTLIVSALLTDNSRNEKWILNETCQQCKNEKEDDKDDCNEYNSDHIDTETENDDESHAKELMVRKLHIDNDNLDYEKMYF